MWVILFGSAVKDLLIVFASFILLICILQIRKLKKEIAQDVRKRLIPQLSLELISDLDKEKAGFYLANESFFLARDIKVEELKLYIEEYGFRKNIILRFENIDFLKPKERIKLKFQVFDITQELFLGEPEKIIPHLVSIVFKAKILYSNIEAIKFYVLFSKRKGKFYIEKFVVC